MFHSRKLFLHALALLMLAGCPSCSDLPELTDDPLQDSTVGAAYSKQLTSTGGQGEYTYTATGLPPGLSISTDGLIDGTATFAGDYTVNVSVTDAAGEQAQKAYPVKIYPVPQFQTTSLPNGRIGAEYSVQLVVSGGKPPLAFTVAPGTLPPGLVFSGSGVLSGTPTQQGESSFTVEVRDAHGVRATRKHSLAIYVSLLVTTSTLPDVYTGSFYDQPLAANGGQAPYSWQLASG